MRDNQVEELAKTLDDFNLVKFVNELPNRSKNGVPVLNLRVKAFKSDQIFFSRLNSLKKNFGCTKFDVLSIKQSIRTKNPNFGSV